MKIAITALGGTLDSQVDPRFGRAKCFLIVDTETSEVEVVDNQQNVNAAQGAGIQAGQLVGECGVKAVLTGHCGPKAFRTLEAAGIDVHVGVEGLVSEAIEQFKAGKLSASKGADVDGHWT